MGLLDLQPALSAGAGGIRGSSSLGHNPLVALFECAAQKLRGAIGVGGQRVGDQGMGREFGESGEAPRLRLVKQRLAVEIEQIKPIRGERQFGAHALQIQLAAEPSRGDLKRMDRKSTRLNSSHGYL